MEYCTHVATLTNSVVLYWECSTDLEDIGGKLPHNKIYMHVIFMQSKELIPPPKKSCVARNRQNKTWEVKTYLHLSQQSRSTILSRDHWATACIPPMMSPSPLHGTSRSLPQSESSLPLLEFFLNGERSEIWTILGLSSPLTEKETESHWDTAAHTKAFQTSELDTGLQIQNSVLNPSLSFPFLPQIISDSRG